MSENVIDNQDSTQVNADDSHDESQLQEAEQEETEQEQEHEESHEDDTREKSLDELPLPGEAADSDKKKELPKWAEKRISKKERELQQAQAEAAAHKAELDRLRSGDHVQQSSFDHEAPKRDDYATEDEYIDARFDYKAKKAELDRHARARNDSMLTAQAEFNKKITTSLNEGSEKYEDFEEKTSALFHPSFPSNRAMAEAIVDSDHSQDIFYFLGMYPDQAIKIAQMNPIQAIKKIAEIEARFKASKKPNISKTPKPLTPVKTNKGSVSEGNPAKLSMGGDFESWYKNKYGK